MPHWQAACGVCESAEEQRQPAYHQVLRSRDLWTDEGVWDALSQCTTRNAALQHCWQNRMTCVWGSNLLQWVLLSGLPAAGQHAQGLPAGLPATCLSQAWRHAGKARMHPVSNHLYPFTYITLPCRCCISPTVLLLYAMLLYAMLAGQGLPGCVARAAFLSCCCLCCSASKLRWLHTSSRFRLR